MAPHQIAVTIHKPADLFIDSPDENPMQPEWEAESGMERIFNYLKTRRLARGVQVTIQYPDTLDIPANAMQRLKEAIDRYSDARISENAQERKFTILTGLTGLAYALAVSVLLSVLLTWLLSVLPLPELLETSLAGLAGIAVWAIVWGPLAAIFFDWLPNWTAIRVYRTIKRGEFVLKPIHLEGTDALF
ncbi:MAG: hypothetical protein JNL34_10705 [Anaerolineae bacterium]|nr:hypothetical protein [Anaerolineae bacterium]